MESQAVFFFSWLTWPKKKRPVAQPQAPQRAQTACLGLGGTKEKPPWPEKKKPSKLGGGFKHFLFSPLFGEDFQFD